MGAGGVTPLNSHISTPNVLAGEQRGGALAAEDGGGATPMSVRSAASSSSSTRGGHGANGGECFILLFILRVDMTEYFTNLMLYIVDDIFRRHSALRRTCDQPSGRRWRCYSCWCWWWCGRRRCELAAAEPVGASARGRPSEASPGTYENYFGFLFVYYV